MTSAQTPRQPCKSAWELLSFASTTSKPGPGVWQERMDRNEVVEKVSHHRLKAQATIGTAANPIARKIILYGVVSKGQD